jgi:intracellular sulfur oxidation DsrE/DsrF family protein
VNDYRVVFDLSTDDANSQQAVIREIDVVTGASPDAQLEVVVYGKGLGFVMADKSTQAAAIQQVLAGRKASFKVCALSMRQQHVTRDQLLPGVEVVPDGIREITSREQHGWGYIKMAY